MTGKKKNNNMMRLKKTLTNDRLPCHSYSFCVQRIKNENVLKISEIMNTGKVSFFHPFNHEQKSTTF